MNLIIVRHGQSAWNLENRFTGEVDVDLTDKGREEAAEAGRLVAATSIPLAIAFTSVLRRSIETLDIMLGEMGNPPLKIVRSKALNERNYGDLQGLNKAETEKKFSPEQVHIWRRSFDIRPPGGESLKDTYERTVPYYTSQIEPVLRTSNVLIVAHGNSLRALMMHLENISADDIAEVNIPTGIPRLYTFNSQAVLDTVRYL